MNTYYSKTFDLCLGKFGEEWLDSKVWPDNYENGPRLSIRKHLKGINRSGEGTAGRAV